MVGLVSSGGFLHRVVDFGDHSLGAVLAVPFLVLAADDWEGIHNVYDGVAGRGEATFEVREVFGRFVARTTVGAAGRAPVAILFGREIQVEEGGVQFTAEQEATVVVNAERRAIPATVHCEWLEVPSGCRRVRALGRLPSRGPIVTNPIGTFRLNTRRT